MLVSNSPASGSKSTTVNRRRFIAGLGLGVGALVFGTPLLSGCGSAVSKTGGGIAAGNAILPVYLPLDFVTPDLPGTPEGVQPAFLSFPANPQSAVEGDIGSGGTVTSMVMTYTAPPPPLPNNPFWKQLNKSLNVEYQPALVPATDFPTKFSAAMAGSALPDLVQVPTWLSLPRLPDLMKSVFEDLTPHLSGDAAKDYPNLANIPSYSWRNGVFGGKMYGVPVHRPPQAVIVFKRSDVISAAGGPADPKNAEEFTELCKAVTDPKVGRYAIGSSAFLANYLNAMFSVPENWKLNDDGTLVKDYETDEWLARVEYTSELFKKGYLHPDSAALSGDKTKSMFLGGKLALIEEGQVWWHQAAVSTPEAKIDGLLPILKDGGQAKQYSGNGAFSFTAIKKATPERVKELLRILNYLASPFGSKEYFEINFGTEGVDHTINSQGIPALTDTGRQNVGLNLQYLGQPPQVLFSNSGLTENTQQQHTFQTELYKNMDTDPTRYHYSETQSKSASLKSAFDDTVTGIIVGRQPLSDLSPAVKKWAEGGGNQIREEMQAALAAEKSGE